MKHFKTLLLGAMASACLSAHGQGLQGTGPGGLYVFGTVSATGQLGSVITFFNQPSSPATHWIEWSNDGTVASACTYKVLTSTDQKHWYDVSGTQNCTANGHLVLPVASEGDAISVVQHPGALVMIYILSYTPADGSTAVSFRYVRGNQ